MTAAFLQSELTSLIADSKKRSTDVRTAAEKSLSDLKSITVTSENQLAADLARRPHFVDPFVLACQSRNAKLAGSATACLQRLVASRAVAKERLEDVLNGYRDVMNTSFEVQLKILQTLPAVLQLYASEVRGQLLARTLEICATLEESRTSLVSSSARATFEQLVDSVFERARVDAKENVSHERTESTGSISTPADDASRIFEDLCSTLNKSESTFLHLEVSSPFFLLENIEKIVEGNTAYLKSKPHLIEACRTQLLPALSTLLIGKDDSRAIAQVLRISLVILQRLPTQLLSDMKDLLGTILAFLDKDRGPAWKRVLGLEFYCDVCSNFGLLLRIFDTFSVDGDNVVPNLMAVFVRIAVEDPTLIGLGRQSTVPVGKAADARQDAMASIEVQGIGGGLASVDSADAGVTGISLDYSTLAKRLLHDEDYSSSQETPRTYLYALILECISTFCEGLSKFIMPLSVSNRHNEDVENVTEDEGDEDTAESAAKKPRRAVSHKYQRLANPLKMSNLPQLAQVQACSKMIDNCWPAVLATCSTFLNAALDSHFYHVLIRSMQKLAQVSGTLGLGTPRDALFTSLAKGSVPPNAAALITLSQSHADIEGDTKLNGVRSPVLETPRSPEPPRQSLNIRHLLCLRALLNLGIALGPTLVQESWFIVIETLQQVETLMSIAGLGMPSLGGARLDSGPESQTSLAGEMSAVNAASKRLFESTKSYSDNSFAAIAQALLRMVGDISATSGDPPKEAVLQSPAAITSPTIQLPKRTHHASRSVSGLWAKTKALDIEVAFVLGKTKELSRVNLHRFASPTSITSTWDLIMPRLFNTAKSPDIRKDLRLQAASIGDLISMEVMKGLSLSQLSQQEIDRLQCRCLEVLSAQVSHQTSKDSLEADDLTYELRKRAFEALENILGHGGESLHPRAWTYVFEILSYGRGKGAQTANGDSNNAEAPTESPGGASPTAFRCVELVCNDFLQLLNPVALQRLIMILSSFGAARGDLNMSLTTVNLLRNISTLLQDRADVLEINKNPSGLSPADLEEDLEPPEVVQRLWTLCLHELTGLCIDERPEVRDASMKILVQVLDGAAEQLTPFSWSVAFEEFLLPTMQTYEKVLREKSMPDFHTSLAKLIESTVELMSEHLVYLSRASAFVHTWSVLLDVLNDVLGNQNVALQGQTFECLARLLQALKPAPGDPSQQVGKAMVLWAQHMPAEDDGDSGETNQSLLAAHNSMFVQAHATSPNATANFSYDGRSAGQHAMKSLQFALLTARHPPYTNDIRKRSIEQDAALETLAVLRQIMQSHSTEYVSVLLDLIEHMRPHQDRLDLQPVTTSTGKKYQKPTYIAMLSSCLELLQTTAKVEENTKTATAWTAAQLSVALHVMSELIKLKYTDIPSSLEAPLWRSATTTVVVILEGTVAQLVPTITKAEIGNINSSITSCLASILGSGGLETGTQPRDHATIEADETFDITHFQRFHAVATTFLSHTCTTSEQRRQYILALFHSSMVAKPWIYDFPSDDSLLTNPISLLKPTRKGSVHPPSFPKRGRMPYAALDALFDLACPQPRLQPQMSNIDNQPVPLDDNNSVKETSTFHPKSTFSTPLAKEATPYILLRIAHPLKTFLTDQPLRGLTPLPMKLQRELEYILRRCVGMRVHDASFSQGLLSSTSSHSSSAERNGEGDAEGEIEDKKQRRSDGKSHLRLLFTLILTSQKGWNQMMRLPDRLGWQDGEVGRGIEEGIERWIQAVGEEWGV